MFGLLDKYMIVQDKKNSYDDNSIKHNIEVISNFHSSKLWVCFLPWHTTIEKARKHWLIPKGVNLILVEEPNAIINVNPFTAKDVLKEIILEVKSEIRKLRHIDSVNVLTYSAGCFAGIYFANHYHIDKLIVVAGGSYLGKSIFTGERTDTLAHEILESGFSNYIEYDKHVIGFHPIDNLKNLPRKDVEIHMSMWDNYIKTKEDMNLVRCLKKEGKTPKVVKYHCLGHMETIMLFGIKNKLGLTKF